MKVTVPVGYNTLLHGECEEISHDAMAVVFTSIIMEDRFIVSDFLKSDVTVKRGDIKFSVGELLSTYWHEFVKQAHQNHRNLLT